MAVPAARLANRRIRLLAALLAAIFCIAVARTAWLQAVQAPSFESLAQGQQRETIRLPAGRGTIYDRMGVPLALGEEATTVFANPQQIRQPRLVAAAVARDLGLEQKVVLKLLSDRSRGSSTWRARPIRRGQRRSRVATSSASASTRRNGGHIRTTRSAPA